MYIGNTMQQIRKKLKMRLTELSQKSGVQIATLSCIEHNKMVGSLESHMNIARALGVDITHLYSNIKGSPQAVELKTAKSPSDVFVHSDQSSYEILTGKVLEKKMMPILLKIEPGGKTHKELNQLGTEKFLFVLEGKIEVHLGTDTYNLTKNSTLYFDASYEHYYVNGGNVQARVLCVSTPAAL